MVSSRRLAGTVKTIVPSAQVETLAVVPPMVTLPWYEAWLDPKPVPKTVRFSVHEAARS